MNSRKIDIEGGLFADLRGGLPRKRGVVFLRGGGGGE